jgi:hypothetical protein
MVVAANAYETQMLLDRGSSLLAFLGFAGTRRPSPFIPSGQRRPFPRNEIMCNSLSLLMGFGMLLIAVAAPASTRLGESRAVEELLRRTIRAHRAVGNATITRYDTCAGIYGGRKLTTYTRIVQSSVSQFVLVQSGSISRKVWYFNGEVTTKCPSGNKSVNKCQEVLV